MKEQPTCICLAGPNGSGKSTLAAGLRANFDLSAWIDPDAVAAELAAAHPELSPDERSARAFRMCRNRRVAYAAELRDFGFETVFSHGSNVAFLRALVRLGYRVSLCFVCTDDPRINEKRVENRVRRGGHGVPEGKVTARYQRALHLLALAVGQVETVLLFDNSTALTEGRGGDRHAGRMFGQVESHADGCADISIASPIPTWAAAFALPPFEVRWSVSALREAAGRTHGLDVDFRPPTAELDRPDGRRMFLEQFGFAV